MKRHLFSTNFSHGGKGGIRKDILVGKRVQGSFICSKHGTNKF